MNTPSIPSCLITIRQTSPDEFVLEGSWPDTRNKARLTIQTDPRSISLAECFILVEETRIAGDKAGKDES